VFRVGCKVYEGKGLDRACDLHFMNDADVSRSGKRRSVYDHSDRFHRVMDSYVQSLADFPLLGHRHEVTEVVDFRL